MAISWLDDQVLTARISCYGATCIPARLTPIVHSTSQKVTRLFPQILLTSRCRLSHIPCSAFSTVFVLSVLYGCTRLICRMLISSRHSRKDRVQHFGCRVWLGAEVRAHLSLAGCNDEQSVLHIFRVADMTRSRSARTSVCLPIFCEPRVLWISGIQCVPNWKRLVHSSWTILCLVRCLRIGRASPEICRWRHIKWNGRPRYNRALRKC